jgi:hypothetical protein
MKAASPVSAWRDEPTVTGSGSIRKPSEAEKKADEPVGGGRRRELVGVGADLVDLVEGRGGTGSADSADKEPESSEELRGESSLGEAEETDPVVEELPTLLPSGSSIVTLADGLDEDGSFGSGEALDADSDADEPDSVSRELGLSVVTSAEALDEGGWSGPSGETDEGESDADEANPVAKEVGLSVVTSAEALEGESDADEANPAAKEVGLSVVTSAEGLEDEG